MPEITDLTTIDPETQSRLRLARAHHRLVEAPELLGHVRALALPTDGRGEPGETYRPMSSPMRLTAADDADRVYGMLVAWTIEWAKRLHDNPPIQGAVAWLSSAGQHLGFRPGIEADEAAELVGFLTRWLDLRLDRIAGHGVEGIDFLEHIAEEVWQLAARYPMGPKRQKLVEPRQCPECDEFAVGASWGPGGVLDVQIACATCEVVFVARRSQIESSVGEAACSHVVPMDTPTPRAPGWCERCDAVLATEIDRWMNEPKEQTR